jgi:formaldehyde-activating enzyme involved in methanogenesis
MTADAVAKAVADAMTGATLDLTDAKGRRIVVPSNAVGYVDIGEETKNRVGFGS